MSARVAPLRAATGARVALLGTGTVGSAAWARLAAWSGTPFGDRLRLVYAANSRHALHDPAGIPVEVGAVLGQSQPEAASLDAVADALDGGGCRIVLDASASEAVAERHADWLARGIHVVTACKLGQGGPHARWASIQAARRRGGACYGDSATVGAGLPILRSLRELQAGGDRIHAVAGVLSGSLAWLFHHYDGLRPFSNFVRAARDAGYTEPDPRDDLSGEDVRRKLLILARTAGHALESDAVQVDSLVPPALRDASVAAFDDALPVLDAPMRERFAAAYKGGAKLRLVARLQAGGRATVGLEALAADDPLAIGGGTDNRVAIWSDRYSERPLVIQGPGAGAQVTAAAMLDDALAIQAEAARAQASPVASRPKNASIGRGRWNT